VEPPPNIIVATFAQQGYLGLSTCGEKNNSSICNRVSKGITSKVSKISQLSLKDGKIDATSSLSSSFSIFEIASFWWFNATIIILSISKGIVKSFGYLFTQYWNDILVAWNYIF